MTCQALQCTNICRTGKICNQCIHCSFCCCGSAQGWFLSALAGPCELHWGGGIRGGSMILEVFSSLSGSVRMLTLVGEQRNSFWDKTPSPRELLSPAGSILSPSSATKARGHRGDAGLWFTEEHKYSGFTHCTVGVFISSHCFPNGRRQKAEVQVWKWGGASVFW